MSKRGRKVHTRCLLIRKNSIILQYPFLNASEVTAVFKQEEKEDLHPIGRPSDHAPLNMRIRHTVTTGRFGTKVQAFQYQTVDSAAGQMWQKLQQARVN